jgi:4'-phosphopantetheinyl transferase
MVSFGGDRDGDMEHLRQISDQPMLLAVNEAHLWSVDLHELDAIEKRQLNAILSPDEQERANRFKFDRHRDRFMIARANLRMILARYLEISPPQIQFGYSSSGKPHLAEGLVKLDDRGTRSLEFNLSHTENLAIYALASYKAIGVDVEYQRSIENIEQLAKRFFNPHEAAQLSGLSAQAQHDLFFQIWTLKEAYLKATGSGLVDLEKVQTDLQNGKVIGLVFPDREQFWQTYQFRPKPNYVAALVVGGAIDKLIDIVPKGKS